MHIGPSRRAGMNLFDEISSIDIRFEVIGTDTQACKLHS